MKPLTVLVTGVGGPGIAGTVYSLRNNPDNRPIEIIGVDSDPNAVGRHLVDSFAVVPLASSHNFINRIHDIAWLHEVNVILPHNTAELPQLATKSGWFAERDITVAISSAVTMGLANNKYKTMQIAKRIDIPVPECTLVKSSRELIAVAEALGYPDKTVIVKPPVSHGGKGFHILAEDYFMDTSELLVSEYLPGKEYSVDCFGGRYQDVAIPRIREKVRDGVAFRTKIDLRTDLIEQSLKLAYHLGLEYAFGFQFKEDAEGMPRLIECNPRVQGTMVASTLAGTNIIYGAVASAAGLPVELDEARDGAIFERYWGGIGDGNVI